jgi:uncharacterized protein (DUF111 family)
MILGAMLDAGLPMERLSVELEKLHLSHASLQFYFFYHEIHETHEIFVE